MLVYLLQQKQFLLPCKKRLAIFPSPAGKSFTKLSLAGNNFGDGKITYLFYNLYSKYCTVGPDNIIVSLQKRSPPFRWEEQYFALIFTQAIGDLHLAVSLVQRGFLLSGIDFSKEGSSCQVQLSQKRVPPVRYSFPKRGFLLSGIAFSKESSSCQVQLSQKRVPPVRYSFLKREFLLSGIAF